MSAWKNNNGASKCVKCPCGKTSNTIVFDAVFEESYYCYDCGLLFDCSNPANPVKCPTKKTCYTWDLLEMFCSTLPNCPSSALCK
jgi:hypothetical protein